MSDSNNSVKFRLALSLSLVMHLFVLIAVGLATFSQAPSQDNGSSMAAVVVDSKILSEDYQRRLKQQMAAEKHQEQMRKQALEKSKFLEKQKIIQQKRLKELEKQRLAVLRQKQSEIAAVKKAALEKKKAEEQTARAIAEAEQAKKIAEQIKHQKEQELSDILSNLTAADPPSLQGEATHSEIDRYKSLVRSAISRHFANAKLYIGKSCTIKIIIAPDGLLIDVGAVEGDPALCREAELATKKAIIPKPTNDWMYQNVKNLTINFRPE